MKPIALTRAVPPSISACELTHLSREPIDFRRAVDQHRLYEEALELLGCTVNRLPPIPDLPDSVFVEDTAVVLPELAIIARPGAVSRRTEVDSVAPALRGFRSVARIEPPGTLDGGDVLRVGSSIYVGGSGRTNADGIRQLAELTSPLGYVVMTVPVSGCLHLKTAATHVADGTLLVNPRWIDTALFDGLERIEVHPAEPYAANALWIGKVVLHAAAYPRTRDRLEARGVTVHPVPADELARAEAGVTCCCILVEPAGGAAGAGTGEKRRSDPPPDP